MLNIVTALKIEAEPIIKHFKLKSRNGIYQNENINLIITGQGKIKSAINTALLVSKHNYPTLNIGIAGSDKYNIGDGFFIYKITDTDNGYNYFPDFFKSFNEEIHTVSKIGKYYNLTDMEASGFFEAAYKFLNVNEIILYKIVSDTPLHQTDKNEIPNLIKSHINVIEELIDDFAKKNDFFNEINNALIEAKNKMKLTKTQENQLKQILTLYKIKNIPFPTFKELKKKEEVKEFLKSLNKSY
ncbi:5'-methylthioadenosine/S-adenosylhomocysteine nucleosidase family protein [Nautilia lithotrophica]